MEKVGTGAMVVQRSIPHRFLLFHLCNRSSSILCIDLRIPFPGVIFLRFALRSIQKYQGFDRFFNPVIEHLRTYFSAGILQGILCSDFQTGIDRRIAFKQKNDFQDRVLH